MNQRITNGAKYFHDMKPSQFSNNYVVCWSQLMKFCELILEEDVRDNRTTEATLYEQAQEIFLDDILT